MREGRVRGCEGEVVVVDGREEEAVVLVEGVEVVVVVVEVG